MASNDIHDLTIIGAGPAGLFAAYYAGFRGLRTKLIDSQPDLGGQVTALYPDKLIYDVAGFPKILGKDLVTNLVAQAMQYQPTVHLNESVHTLDRLPDSTIRMGTDLGEHLTKVVVITAGIGAFTPKTFKRPELDQWIGKGLYFAVRQKEDFRGKHLLVIGGGDSALDWALGLVGYATEITLIHRRDAFRAHEDTIYPGKLKLIATGFGEAATAINNAVTYVNPNASAFPGHSSTIMEKKEKTAAKAGAS